MSALYLMRYHGAASAGTGILYMGHGVIAGVDVGEVRYEGQYWVSQGRRRITGVMAVPAGVTLATGYRTAQHGEVEFVADWPEPFDDGHPQPLCLPGGSIRLVFEKINDLP